MQDSASDRTEKPTARRLSDARNDGNIPSSTEMPHAIGLGFFVIALAFAGASLFHWFQEMLTKGFSFPSNASVAGGSFLSLAGELAYQAFLHMLPFMVAAALSSIASGILVSGWSFSWKAMEWKLSRINPITGAKNLISLKSIINMVFSIVKLIAIGVVIWLYLRDKMDVFLSLRWATPVEIVAKTSELVFGVLLRFTLCMVVIAIIDTAYQRWNYKRELRMTKKEVRDESKQYEMPAEAKSKMRAKQIAVSRRRMMAQVPKADVVITNPTHVAVALQYDPATMSAPRLVAKGGDFLCEKIKEIAAANNVPIIRRPELARAIFSTVEIDQNIPEGLFVAVAQIMAMVYKLRNKKLSRPAGIVR